MKEIIITQNNKEEIIAKYLDGRASEAEINALTQWRENADENENYYREINLVNSYFLKEAGSQVSVDDAWKKVSTRIQNKTTQDKNHVEKPFAWKYIGYAASIIILATAVYVLRPEETPTQIITSDFSLNHKLKDGSEILLQANSYLSKTSENSREYDFRGSAKFDVLHNDDDPFVVHIDQIIVKDLGTVFDLKALPGSDTVFVKVSEGLVQFYSLVNAGISLEEGEEGMYVKSKNKFYKRASDPENAYLTKAFQEASLSEVIDYLAYTFRKNILIENDDIINCNIHVDFTKAPYQLVKEIIEETLNITITEKDDSIILSGEGCH
jgi:ferric-dicitrate binding protein FerR (iron transport regulator)